MTEKRFKVEKNIFDEYCIFDNYIRRYYTYEKQDLEKICGKLNKSDDENWRLNRAIRDLFEIKENQSMRINELDEENKELKKRVMILQDKIKGLMK